VVRLSNGRSIQAAPHGSPAVRRAERRRVEILRAAARVFRERGFANAGMREIATAADLSPANLYHYFAGKDELLFFCQDRTLDRLLAAAAEARAGRGATLPRVRTLAAIHVRCIVDEVEGSAAHFEVDALPPKLRATIVAKRDRYEQAVRALISGGMRKGELARLDATIATRAFLGALNWTAQWFRPDGTHTAELVADSVAAYAVAGLENRHRDTRAHRPPRQRRAGRNRVRAAEDTPRGVA
jgi:AcrR family transcriptional regulator